MSSLAYSLALSVPKTHSAYTCKSCLSPENRNKNDLHPTDRSKTSKIQQDSCSSKVSSWLVISENSSLCSRREFIAVGVSSVGSVAAGSIRTEFAEAVEGACDDYTVSPSGLSFCDQVVGVGPEATPGQLIKAHYVGKLESGKIFDSSYNRGKPLIFRIGVGEVITGWDQGILGSDGVPPMKIGGKRKLKIPSSLGYGMRGAGCKGGSCIIPPDSVLFFDVEFVGKA